MKALLISCLLLLLPSFLYPQPNTIEANPSRNLNTLNLLVNTEDRVELTLISDFPKAKSSESIASEVTLEAQKFSLDIDKCLAQHKIVVDKMKSLQKSFGDFLDLFYAQPLWDAKLETDWNEHFLNHINEGKN